MPNKNLKDFDLAELRKLGEKPFYGSILFTWLHNKAAASIAEITALPKTFRADLQSNGFVVENLQLLKRADDPDGTRKYLFNLPDGQKIETVLLRDGDRRTLCVSTQVGCRMACAFCATGRMRFRRNLSAGEIVDQVIQVEKIEKTKIQNLVYMGMGEPLDNYENVLKSIRILNNQAGKNIGARHITISTCGLVPGIEKLADEGLQVRLAVSLHAATDAVRGKLMPINKKYPVADLRRALQNYQKKTGRRLTFEYIMLDGVNDTREHARGLLKLLGGLSAQINLLEYNPHLRADFRPSPRKTIREFWWITTDRGFATAIRYKRGQNISAACGQLYADN
ncbi:23S rRNA (adenine(2503)-C(2))-methyltransferase [Candidatus Termititenax persephonae]|uniref:Probable dual-specificity RNA methyltransferase RlmN n=1 Tax=Candidatus Termititenax persephonae TaxID=2218525 RepID=A0A388TFQ1_9BACT|nr:23S rRNA (adenine(2503)-C(2))-methyltransferase [Candidatus Termititenax persephonae]